MTIPHALTTLNNSGCNVTDEGLQALSSLTALSTLNLSWCGRVTAEGLQTLNSLTALTSIYLYGCPNVTAAANQALRTAIPNLGIVG
jgi:F-box/leucine-rich repeat protein 14